jgi:prepilin-type N-terminal cleavage/methylation domain-containing protein
MLHARKQGFTIVELLIVIVVIGVLAAIVVVAYNGVTESANGARMNSDLRNIKNAISRLSVDTNGTLFGCPTNSFGPEGSVGSPNAGLVSIPVAGTTQESCTWSAGAVSSWRGPYIQALTDPWDQQYRIDLDYFICENGSGRLIAVVLSNGPDGSLEYPTTANSGACTVNSSDDIYLELWR